jgi:hypothetical protein
MSEEQRSTLDLHVRAKQQELRAHLDDASAEYRLKEELSKNENISPGSNPGVDALFVQLALLDLPKSAAMELLPSDDQRGRGLLDNPTAALKIAGQRLFHSYSAALHTVVCEKAADDVRQQVLSAISAGSGVGMITTAFIAIGVSTTVAPLAASLLLAIIVRPTVNEVCKMWSETLKEPKTT